MHFWMSLRVRLTLSPFLELWNQISDSTSYINELSVQTHACFVPVDKHRDETAPTLLEHQLLPAILLNDDVTLTCHVCYDV